MRERASHAWDPENMASFFFCFFFSWPRIAVVLPGIKQCNSSSYLSLYLFTTHYLLISNNGFVFSYIPSSSTTDGKQNQKPCLPYIFSNFLFLQYSVQRGGENDWNFSSAFGHLYYIFPLHNSVWLEYYYKHWINIPDTGTLNIFEVGYPMMFYGPIINLWTFKETDSLVQHR